MLFLFLCKSSILAAGCQKAPLGGCLHQALVYSVLLSDRMSFCPLLHFVEPAVLSGVFFFFFPEAEHETRHLLALGSSLYISTMK